jgi:hypothetical protein
MAAQALIDRARSVGALPESVQPGMVFRRVAMLCVDGTRFRITAHDHTRIEIIAIPGARKKTYSYVKLDPKPMGNGRPDRGISRCGLSTLARHYEASR